MICKCPKCNSYVTGVIDKFLYAGIIGRQSCSEIQHKGTETANALNKWTRSKLGNMVGNTIGTLGKGAIGAASTAVGQGRAFLHSASSLMDSEEYFSFQCSNSKCKYEWVERKSDALDVTNEFYESCAKSFKSQTGRRYLVINPDAKIAYQNTGNTYMLQSLPKDVFVPENSVNYGEIYISHPANHNVFYSLESYRINVLEDELNDLKQFLLKLGAKSISIIGMNDNELSDNRKSVLANIVGGNNKIMSANAETSFEFESEEYRRLRSRFQSTIKGERQVSPILDNNLYNKWSPINSEWSRILELRKNGTIEYTFSVETEALTNARKMELDKVKASYTEFGMSAENDYTKQAISRLKESKRMRFSVKVEFYPLSEYQNAKILNE